MCARFNTQQKLCLKNCISCVSKDLKNQKKIALKTLKRMKIVISTLCGEMLARKENKIFPP